ncbi:FABP family protein [Streptomyces sp. SID13666]|uniref:FABP family protein n=1 Tax=Streptomyces TaxID=1883 RepID=UPI001106EF6A|nr:MULTISPECIES: FABP family protein [Streptomyces]MCZ4099458.1 FABP family protein [Streptomyces sp. H39-C1]NEA56684.1 FABP family protein [Streptomyces sp. SID13666]NEA73128.1 FABP family protein [Streptomyces sp. SID13588]QNA74563.1 FABP family protein [Streptomyces sp. So13.3]
MIEIPSDLHPDLVPLVFLLGRWEGAGVYDFPGAEKCNFGQEVTFSHDGRSFLEYTSHTWVLDAEGKKLRPLESESGFWRIDKDRKVDVTVTRDEGVIEIWTGELADQKPQIDIVTDAVARLPEAPEYSGGKRLYGYVNSDLMWVGEKATPAVTLRPYMSAHLKKVVDPREWAKDLKDLPDDGIAFFK